MGKNSKAFISQDYDAYEQRLKEEVTVKVTTPDPADGHTHVVYVGKNGHGMTMPYPENEEECFQHKHLIINNEVVLHSSGWSISFHSGLQDMSEADLKEHVEAFRKANDKEAKALNDVFKSELEKEGD